LRKNGWNKFFKNVTSFCEKHDNDVPNFGHFHSISWSKSIIFFYQN